jgi:hypothetical protein
MVQQKFYSEDNRTKDFNDFSNIFSNLIAYASFVSYGYGVFDGIFNLKKNSTSVTVISAIGGSISGILKLMFYPDNSLADKVGITLKEPSICAFHYFAYEGGYASGQYLKDEIINSSKTLIDLVHQASTSAQNNFHGFTKSSDVLMKYAHSAASYLGDGIANNEVALQKLIQSDVSTVTQAYNAIMIQGNNLMQSPAMHQIQAWITAQEKLPDLYSIGLNATIQTASVMPALMQACQNIIQTP